MLSIAVLIVLAGSVAFAATPDGFQPASTADLMVTFNGLAVDASGGKAVLKESQYNRSRVEMCNLPGCFSFTETIVIHLRYCNSPDDHGYLSFDRCILCW